MNSKRTRVNKNEGLNVELQEIIDAVEDELLVVDAEYRVRFANATVLSKHHDKDDSPIGKYCYQVFQG